MKVIQSLKSKTIPFAAWSAAQKAREALRSHQEGEELPDTVYLGRPDRQRTVLDFWQMCSKFEAIQSKDEKWDRDRAMGELGVVDDGTSRSVFTGTHEDGTLEILSRNVWSRWTFDDSKVSFVNLGFQGGFSAGEYDIRSVEQAYQISSSPLHFPTS